MNRTRIAKLFLAALLTLPWLTAASGCVYRVHDERGWRRDWDERREWREHRDWDDHDDDRRYCDPHRDWD